LREECRLRVFDNIVLKIIFGPKRDEVTEDWRRLHNKQLDALHSSPNFIRVNKSRILRWAVHVARIGRREVLRGFWWENQSEGNHFEDRGVDGDNIKIDVKQMGWGMDWITLAQYRDRWRAFVNAVMNLRFS
jgi:hypothetical protein